MENKRKNAVLEILNYWKITEFLGQIDIPQESTENKKLIKNIKNGKEVKAEKIEVFFDLPVLSASDIDLEMILENDRDDYAKFPSVGDEIYFCLGKVERNTVVDYLEKFIEDKSDNPEIAYPKRVRSHGAHSRQIRKACILRIVSSCHRYCGQLPGGMSQEHIRVMTLLSILTNIKNLLERSMGNCRTRMLMSSFQPYMKRFLTSM